MAEESCGKCIPCRLGSQRALELAQTPGGEESLPQLERLFEIMTHGSLCAFGQQMPGPMSEMVKYFGDRVFK
jgi:NADH:ubiquinone oxidoreductase subunit F (NADH-binding)